MEDSGIYSCSVAGRNPGFQAALLQGKVWKLQLFFGREESWSYCCSFAGMRMKITAVAGWILGVKLFCCREESGSYGCSGRNTEGKSSSNSLVLDVKCK